MQILGFDISIKLATLLKLLWCNKRQVLLTREMRACTHEVNRDLSPVSNDMSLTVERRKILDIINHISEAIIKESNSASSRIKQL